MQCKPNTHLACRPATGLGTSGVILRYYPCLIIWYHYCFYSGNINMPLTKAKLLNSIVQISHFDYTGCDISNKVL